SKNFTRTGARRASRSRSSRRRSGAHFSRLAVFIVIPRDRDRAYNPQELGIAAAAAVLDDRLSNSIQEATMQLQTGTIEELATGVVVRDGTPEDAEVCGRIFYDAFEGI